MNPIRRRRGIRTYPATSETCVMQSQNTDRDHAGRHHPGHRDTGGPDTGRPAMRVTTPPGPSPQPQPARSRDGSWTAPTRTWRTRASLSTSER